MVYMVLWLWCYRIILYIYSAILEMLHNIIVLCTLFYLGLAEAESASERMRMGER